MTARLAALGEKLGASSAEGAATRENCLGMQLLNGEMWEEVPWHAIALALPTEVHAWVRPLLVKLVGPGGKLHGPGGRWTHAELADAAADFFRGRRAIAVNADLRTWCCVILHRVHLGIELSEDEAEGFMAMQMKVLAISGFPAASLRVGALRKALDIDKIKAEKASWLERYKPALRAVLPAETARLSDDEFSWFASAVMDSLLFAGGQSVPTVMGYCLALPYSEWGHENLPAGFALDDTASLPSYIFETIRRFPPVGMFPLVERSAGSEPDRRVFLNIHMAQRDEKVWGANAETEFRLRPVAEYHKHSLAFADAALAPHLASANSHACPGKELAFGLVLALLKEFAHTASGVASAGGTKALWKCDKAPEEIKITAFSSGKFTLTRDTSVVAPPPAPRSGDALLEVLTDAERARLEKEAQTNNKFDECNRNTKLFIGLVQMVVKPNKELVTSSKVSGTVVDKQSYDEKGKSWYAPFGGFRFIIEDEDRAELGFLQGFNKMLMFAAAQRLSFEEDEAADKMVWFDSPAQGIAMMHETFGRCLPAQFASWTDAHTDEQTANVCVYGLASWYLRPARSAAEAGHAVPDGAVLESNLEYMGKYETRPDWIRYGATAYLGAPPALADGKATPGALLGVWSCHHGKLFLPGDAQWEHAKASFRSSLVASITCKDHLGQLHWIYANGLNLAARETLGKDHPLRRLLKQHYFGTSEINYSSKDMLLPVGQFAHRCFGFSEKGWLEYFGDVVAEWKWTPLPEKLRASGLPEDFIAVWPIAQDAEQTWRTLETYVRRVVDIWYPAGDGDVLADGDIVAFWAHFETQFATPWRLPPLTRDALVTLLTDLIWWVTAGHEFVGSIVEYLTSPLGFPGKLRDGSAVSDVQSYAQGLVIIALTGLRQPPLMSDWTHIFEVASWPDDKRQATVDAVRALQVELADVADDIDAKNDARERRGERAVPAFNPRILETSVSI